MRQSTYLVPVQGELHKSLETIRMGVMGGGVVCFAVKMMRLCLLMRVSYYDGLWSDWE